MLDAGLLLLGLLSGLLVGLTGAGVGSITTAGLMLFWPGAYPPTTVVGSSTAQGVASRAAGLVRMLPLEKGEKRSLTLLLSAGIPASLIGAAATGYLAYLRLFEPALGTLLLVAGAQLAFESLVRTGNRKTEFNNPKSKIQNPKSTLLLGAAVGLFTGLTSFGAGSLVAALAPRLLSLSIHRTVRLAILGGGGVLAASSVAHGILGHIDPYLTLTLTAGSVPGLLVGVEMGRAAPKRTLRFLVGAVLVIAAVRLLVKIATGRNFIVF